MSDMEKIKLFLYWLKELALDTLAAWAYVWAVSTVLYLVLVA